MPVKEQTNDHGGSEQIMRGIDRIEHGISNERGPASAEDSRTLIILDEPSYGGESGRGENSRKIIILDGRRYVLVEESSHVKGNCFNGVSNERGPASAEDSRTGKRGKKPLFNEKGHLVMGKEKYADPGALHNQKRWEADRILTHFGPRLEPNSKFNRENEARLLLATVSCWYHEFLQNDWKARKRVE